MGADPGAPQVTVGMPTYNRARLVRASIEDVLAQTFRDFELIVSDDASSDDTDRVVEEIRDPRLRYRRNERNLKIPGNLNRILEEARGRYIVFLHDHDRFAPDLLERMVTFLDAEPRVGFVHTGIAFVDEDGGNYANVSPDFERITPSRAFVDRLLLGQGFECPVSACGMLRREALEEVGCRFDDECGFVADIDVTLRLGARHDVGYISEPLIRCRRRETGHELARPNWDLVRWLVRIHRLNVARCYGQDPAQRERAERLLHDRESRLLRRTLAASLAWGDPAVLAEGLEMLQGRGSAWARPAAALARGAPGLLRLALATSQVAARVRRALRSGAQRTG